MRLPTTSCVCLRGGARDELCPFPPILPPFFPVFFLYFLSFFFLAFSLVFLPNLQLRPPRPPPLPQASSASLHPRSLASALRHRPFSTLCMCAPHDVHENQARYELKTKCNWIMRAPPRQININSYQFKLLGYTWLFNT